MYFTPEMIKNNQPIKLNSSKHIKVVIASLVLWTCVGVGVGGLNSFMTPGATGVIIGISYLIYIIASCCFSDIKNYISNTKKFD